MFIVADIYFSGKPFASNGVPGRIQRLQGKDSVLYYGGTVPWKEGRSKRLKRQSLAVDQLRFKPFFRGGFLCFWFYGVYDMIRDDDQKGSSQILS